MAYVKSKKMRSKKKARKSRKMKRIRGGMFGVQGPSGGETAVPVTNAGGETAVPVTNAGGEIAVPVTNAGSEASNVLEPASEAPRPTLQDLIGELNNFMPKLSSELADELRGIIDKFR